MSEWSPRVNEIFLAAMEIASAEARDRYIGEACADDAALRGAVLRLVEASKKAGAAGFLESPPLAAGGPEAAGLSPRADHVGAVIGNYRLSALLGEGGFGVVYAAEQLRPLQRTVAIKIIKPGLDTARVVARFEAERQALAMMDHPNIARVLDAGTIDDPPVLSGRPYFVMELVQGVPITRYCDEAQLSPRQRLELFIPVCAAVQHAHQKGVIHRDLKPSNVMVALYDGRAVPKVIDFGVAKAIAQKLTDHTLFTEVGGVIGTLEYMSPEQAELGNADIDTRADIYSLGVILYELLAGSPPFTSEQLRGAAFDQMLRMIREIEPSRPSTKLSTSAELPSIAARRRIEPDRLTRLVNGDLDWIVMKALEKDRSRRYATANGLALDLQHYLADEPVTAAAPSAVYRMRKFVRRHKVPVLAAGAIALALVGGVVGTTWGLIRADAARKLAADRAEGERQAKETAQQRETETRAVLDFVETRVFAAARPAGQQGGLGQDVTLRKAIDAAIPFVDSSFANQPLVEARLRVTIGRSLLFLGERQRAAGQLRRARELNLRLRGPENVETQNSTNDLANCCDMLGQHAEAIMLHTENLAQRRATLGPNHPSTLLTMMNLANAYNNVGRYGEALSLQRETLALQQAALGSDHPDTLKTMNNMSVTYTRLGMAAEALTLREQTFALRKARLGPDHVETLSSMQNLAKAYYDVGRYAEATKLHEETLVLTTAKLGPRHPETIRTMHTLASDYRALGRYAEAIELAEQARELRSEVLGPHHPDTFGAMTNLANVYEAAGRKAEALRLREETLALQKVHEGVDHPSTLMTMNNLAVSYADAGRCEEALKLHQETLALRKVKLGEDHPETLVSMGSVGACMLQLGKGEEGIKLIDDSISRSATRPANAQFIPWILGERLAYFERTRDAAGCRRTAEMWESLGFTDAESYFTAAKFRAKTAAAIRPMDPAAAEAEAGKAIGWLNRAIAAGFAQAGRIDAEPDLEALRSRPDFPRLQPGTRPAGSP